MGLTLNNWTKTLVRFLASSVLRFRKAGGVRGSYQWCNPNVVRGRLGCPWGPPAGFVGGGKEHMVDTLFLLLPWPATVGFAPLLVPWCGNGFCYRSCSACICIQLLVALALKLFFFFCEEIKKGGFSELALGLFSVRAGSVGSEMALLLGGHLREAERAAACAAALAEQNTLVLRGSHFMKM